VCRSGAEMNYFNVRLVNVVYLFNIIKMHFVRLHFAYTCDIIHVNSERTLNKFIRRMQSDKRY
jgi:hypothetical protein